MFVPLSTVMLEYETRVMIFCGHTAQLRRNCTDYMQTAYNICVYVHVAQSGTLFQHIPLIFIVCIHNVFDDRSVCLNLDII